MSGERYLLFHSEKYYPNGGMQDCLGSYATVELAEQALFEKEQVRWDEQGLLEDEHGALETLRWAYVYDLETRSIVKGLDDDGVSAVVDKIRYFWHYGEEQFLRGRPNVVLTDYIRRRAKEGNG